MNFRIDGKALTIPIKCLEAVLATAAEEKDAPREGIEMEALLNYVSKRIDPSTHVGLTANNEHATQFCQINHGSRTCLQLRA